MKQLIGTHVGFIFDENEETPHVAAMLRVTSDICELQIPMLEGVTDPYGEWFPSMRREGQANGTLPDNIVFSNTDLTVDLTDLRNRNYVENWGSAHRTGVISVGRVVETGITAPKSYMKINGLTSEVVGLPSWISPDVFSSEATQDEKGRIKVIEFKCERQPGIEVSGVQGLTLRPYFEYTHDWANRKHGMRETMQVESRFDEPADWRAHHRLHQTIQDLVSIAFWFPCNLAPARALREDDPARDIGGGSHGEQWRDMIMPSFGRRSVRTPVRELPKDRRALFTFDEIGEEGLAKWFDEYESLGQAMWVLSSSLFREGSTVEIRLLQIGTALEALGYELAIRSGRLARGVKDSKFFFTSALKAIAANTDCSLDKVLGAHANIDEWADSFNATYKGVKHADNPFPDPTEAYLRADEGIWLARLWLGRHLGADRGKMESNAQNQNQAY